LHGKVALADDAWSTVGSSNLDPLSLALNLEANVVIRDRDFTAALRASLQRLIEEHCHEAAEPPGGKSWLWRATIGFVVFHFLHRFPAWAGLLPAHTPRLAVVPPPSRRADADGDVPSHEAG